MHGGEDAFDVQGKGWEVDGHGVGDGDGEEGRPAEAFDAYPFVFVCGGGERGLGG